jgi:lysophospholipase L1-like esterase
MPFLRYSLALFLTLGFSMLMSQSTFSYLALGDSYTIGEAVAASDRWPVQLTTRLRAERISIADPTIVATTGWTTAELQAGISQVQLATRYDLVSLLIGVNNQYRGYDMAIYEREFAELLDQAIQFAGGNVGNVFVISIPDYGVTPFAVEKGLSPAKIATDLDVYNSLAQKMAKTKGVQFFEITKWSRNAATDSSLIAEDGLHPSGKMYANWVDTCFNWVRENLLLR